MSIVCSIIFKKSVFPLIDFSINNVTIINMEKWGYYIRKLREEVHPRLTQQELANRAGFTRQHIQAIEKGRFKTYKDEYIYRLAPHLNISPDDLFDLIRGREESRRPKETPEQILERLRVSISSTVPIYEDYPYSPHAGKPVEPVDHVYMVRDRAKGRRLEGYISHGKCLEPEIKDGDIIIVDRDGEIDTGNIVACLADGMLHLARLRKIADEFYLENNEKRIKLDQCEVVAPVIEIRRRIK